MKEEREGARTGEGGEEEGEEGGREGKGRIIICVSTFKKEYMTINVCAIFPGIFGDYEIWNGMKRAPS